MVKKYSAKSQASKTDIFPSSFMIERSNSRPSIVLSNSLQLYIVIGFNEWGDNPLCQSLGGVVFGLYPPHINIVLFKK